jgi:hypothetical protein
MKAAVGFFVLAAATPALAADSSLPIGIIDFYGLRSVPAEKARAALPFKVGDRLSLEGDRPPVMTEAEKRLAALPGVAHARTAIVCCDGGRLLVYVGVEETGTPALPFRAPPKGSARLPADVVKAGDDYEKALTVALRAGDSAEDDSKGHALSPNPGLRAIQERFLALAARDPEGLRMVLRESSESDHRALAAQVLGYVADKAAVVPDLAYAMSDPADDVRNNAMRALMVFASMTMTTTTTPLRIPGEPFVALLDSPAWTDRNKAAGALAELSKDRPAELMTALRRRALPSLAEMARWKSGGHAWSAYFLLARIAEYSEAAAQAAWDAGRREEVITAAIRRGTATGKKP